MWKIKRGSFKTERRGKRTEKYENFLDKRKLRKPIKTPKPREEYPGDKAQTCQKEKGHAKGIHLESKQNCVKEAHSDGRESKEVNSQEPGIKKDLQDEVKPRL